MTIKRGDIFLDVDFGEARGSVQSGARPCLVVSNKLCNMYSPVITVLPITAQVKADMPTHFHLDKNKYKLKRHSIVLAEQIITVDKSYLKNRHFKSLTRHDLALIDDLLRIQLELN